MYIYIDKYIYKFIHISMLISMFATIRKFPINSRPLQLRRVRNIVEATTSMYRVRGRNQFPHLSHLSEHMPLGHTTPRREPTSSEGQCKI